MLALLFIILGLIVLYGSSTLWWKLFKLSNKRREQAFSLLEMQATLASRERITGKGIARLVFYATIIIVMVFGGGAIVNKLLGG